MPKQIGQKQLVQIFQDVKEMGTHKPKFCFLIGAGASKSSGIPTGWELANEWYQELKDILEPSDLKQWQDKVKFIEERLGEFYPELYEKRFRSNPKVGYEKFKKIMGGKEPDLGYVILSQILSKEPHNFVITTNFDYLIEDAIRQFTDTKPFVAGHETLAGFVSSQRDRPTIVKVHRDLFLNPINDTEGTDRLKAEWKETLRPILKDYNLLVIGYGGNDGSLMDYLREIGEENRESIYWCLRKGDDLNKKVKNLLRENDYMVLIDGFDELMYLLRGGLKYDIFENLSSPEHPFLKNAQKHNDRLHRRMEEIIELRKSKTNRLDNEDDPVESLLSGDWGYLDAAEEESDIIKKKKIYQEGIRLYPSSTSLIGNYAIFLEDIKEYDEAEKYYRNALDIDAEHAINNGNYATFLRIARKDFDKAEEYYRRALKVDPEYAINNGNYASFLECVRKDFHLAGYYYEKALKHEPNNPDFNGNYGHSLILSGNNFDSAKELIDKAFDLNPVDDLKAELWFYRFAHYPEHRDQAEKELKKLIKEGAKSIGWNFQGHIDIAEKNGHPKLDKLKEFAKALGEER